jgi:uncharacterized protein YbjT (DUF2867 family)
MTGTLGNLTDEVLVVGGTGHLGRKVVEALQARGKRVRALVRPGSDASALEAQSVRIIRGDMLDPASLDLAMEGVDAVITTAAGYTGHTEGDSADIDITGNSNLAEAAQRAGVRRFVLTSILTCDQTPQVPHFWHKKLAEDRLEELGVPFVALRPGAFLDQLANMGGDQFAQRQLTWFGSTSTPLTFVLTSDLAGNLADAVDAEGVEGQRIDIGWDRPVSIDGLAELVGQAVTEPVAVNSIPLPPADAVSDTDESGANDMVAMMRYFTTGKYVADTSRQSEVFGTPPEAADAVNRLLAQLGHLPR